jgi:hypothetical protein
MLQFLRPAELSCPCIFPCPCCCCWCPPLVIGCMTLLSNACSNLGASVSAILAAGSEKWREQEHNSETNRRYLHQHMRQHQRCTHGYEQCSRPCSCACWYLLLSLWRCTLFHRIECAELISTLHAVDDARQICQDAQAATQQHTATSSSTRNER